MWEMIQQMAGDRLWIYTSIAGSLLGVRFCSGSKIQKWQYGQ